MSIFKPKCLKGLELEKFELIRATDTLSLPGSFEPEVGVTDDGWYEVRAGNKTEGTGTFRRGRSVAAQHSAGPQRPLGTSRTLAEAGVVGCFASAKW
jgi:hypothetical protein